MVLQEHAFNHAGVAYSTYAMVLMMNTAGRMYEMVFSYTNVLIVMQVARARRLVSGCDETNTPVTRPLTDCFERSPGCNVHYTDSNQRDRIDYQAILSVAFLALLFYSAGFDVDSLASRTQSEQRPPLLCHSLSFWHERHTATRTTSSASSGAFTII